MIFTTPDSLQFTIYNIMCVMIQMFAVVFVFIAIAADFILYDDKENIKKSKRSIVATGTMTAFFVLYYIVIKLNFKEIPLWQQFLGTFFVVLGAIFNIIGRLNLKENWGNHIKIYDNHRLITKGLYKVVRHPLYSSIMLMLFGGSVAYGSILSFILTVVIFIPFMYYRAKQEEELLCEEFEDYKEYQSKTGMFFPKFWR